MSSYETWANLNRLVREGTGDPLTREAELRRERIAVGMMCECGDCICCTEFKTFMCDKSHGGK